MNYLKIATIFLLLIFINCKKDDDNTIDTNGEFVTATVDGSSYQASAPTNIQTFDVTFFQNGGENRLEMFGRSIENGNDYKQIGMIIIGYTGIGEYIIGDSDVYDGSFNYRNRSGSVSYINNINVNTKPDYMPARITITKDDDTMVEGTFEFIGYEVFRPLTIEITAGSFRLFK